ncbi:aKG-HExxH-type peptide beta-hydroxylase [Pseudomonas chlororaphis]|uniref:aKG-HExxH-type peptide beta-hydroxylase n=1 Tax=Pseudomonas chlororaphis TaxID=587753 RepID=UPI0021C31457|nr:HEXXH motif-containing putative peptide modification protein [Pseudomonas chlororaphis]
MPLQGKLLEFCDVLKRIDVARDESPPVYRFDADPLIAQVTPPSYEFPQDEHLRKQLERGGYSTAFFRDVMQIALLRIQHTWPECHRQWQVLVKAVCYLPDGAFRSCSASRYTGVILLSSRDNSILDMEESLVHEAIHQLLYNIVEVCPVVDPQASRETLFTLPWSGQQRDLYGYFHAFYVYVALVKYLERVKSRPPRELQAARERLGFILRGLVRALPDFAASPDFTPQGRELLENLMREVQDLALRHAALLGDGEPAAGPVLGMTA